MEKILQEIILIANTASFCLTGKSSLYIQGIKTDYEIIEILTNDSGLALIANSLNQEVDLSLGFAQLYTVINGTQIKYISCNNNPNQQENFIKDSVLCNYKNTHIQCLSLTKELEKLNNKPNENATLIAKVQAEIEKRKKIKVIIIHGHAVTPEDNWFPWLSNELTKYGYCVNSPSMPLSINPILEEWLDHIKKVISTPDENTYLIGHGIGSTCILKYLEKLSKNKLLGGAVLVSCFIDKLPYKELDNFFAKKINYEKIKPKAKKIVCIFSNDDPHIPLKIGESIKTELEAKIIICPNGGHLNQKSGYSKLPEAFDALQEMIKKNN